eukprot:gnl/TRDRNA2_/TRDRNA2_174230_c4_seq25.p1 gnl/TRDRNA2_/TRDRNA2_174230_c4~~gnl/TRDRNA2_/TRDRNA2_174230_c4_seq25.p1  ORF type:complete len:473 (-),score=98.85 gnl/TRDRNA2_/TRDRNA2_174230_c4_seq25:158-1498(-)
MAAIAVEKYVAEFVGTFLLVFTVGCNVLSGSPVWAVTSIACVLMVSIYALGGVSGANFNPAVSLTLGLSNKLDWMNASIYCIVQLVAGIAAGFCYAGTFGDSFNLGPTKGFNWWQAGLAETLYTFMLCFVVLNVATSKKHAGKNQFYGLAIGFVIVAGGYGAGHISGGCFNPAVAFGIDVSSFKLGVRWCFIYTAFEIVGAALAAGLYRVCRPDDFQDEEISDYPLSSKICSEFLGTYILVLTVGLNVLGGSPAGAFSIAASLMCMIYALGSCSGAHFNPAVTLAIFIRKKISIKEAGYYVVVQILGGMTGAFTYALMEKRETFGLGPVGDYGWFAAAVAEIVFTFVLCYVVLCVATTEKGLSNYFGLAIGMCVTVGGYAIGAVSGGSLNPAVSIAIASSHLLNKGAFWQCLVYSLFEFMGAGAAAGLFMVTHADEFKQDKQALEQ